ncbi:SpoIIE family protein phosphatase [Bremerella cremea]|uniref:SpoIIE family protein phosphatase n=1 Tax=Bremerella cremea TaxID=1031537 RepID=UPI0031EAD945
MTTTQLQTGRFVRNAVGHCVGGDLAIVEIEPEFVFLALVDVLGHGPQAYSTAIEIEEAIRGWTPKWDLLSLMRYLQEHQAKGRGAVVGLVTIEPSTGAVRYVGIGNTVCRTLGTHPRHMLTREGVVGQTMRTPSLETQTLQEDELLLLHSDGVSGRFELDQCPQLRCDTSQRAAQRVVETFGQPHDDASCIVARFQ